MTKTAAPMTSGSIWKQMTFFAMPIFLGNSVSKIACIFHIQVI